MTTIETESLDQLLDPFQETLTPDVARRLVQMRASAAAQARLELLSERHRSGQISPEELDEYTALVRAGAMISLLQAKARRMLRSEGNG